jgi:hypothetical protein
MYLCMLNSDSGECVAVNSLYTQISGIFAIAVIWNPWAEYAKEIPDFGDDEFPNMVCVEAARVAAPIVLLPGTAFEASQILQVPMPSYNSRETSCSTIR